MMLISIGANLPTSDGTPPLETCRRAAVALDRLPGLRLRALSRWYRTSPVLAPSTSVTEQPDYVNGTAHLVTDDGGMIDPAVLLERLMQIETAAGRVRTTPHAPRVLDLDIVAMGGLVRQSPDPVLPHPRAHERAFVLVPLAEVAPGWMHPVLGRTVEELIAGLQGQQVQTL